MNKKLLGFYNYTVVLTYVGMLFGFTGLALVILEEYFWAVNCLMFAGLCDMFDGTIASTMKRTKQEKNFGIQIDSLSDLICFGVLPGVLVLSLNDMAIASIVVAACYVLAALIRLAYFNVDEQDRQDKTDESRKIFYGCPVTMSALVYPLTYGVGVFFGWNVNHFMTVMQGIMAVCFLLAIPLKKPGKIGKCILLGCGLVEMALLFIIR